MTMPIQPLATTVSEAQKDLKRFRKIIQFMSKLKTILP